MGAVSKMVKAKLNVRRRSRIWPTPTSVYRSSARSHRLRGRGRSEQNSKDWQKLFRLLSVPSRKTPSFSVNPDKQFYYCRLWRGGNALGFIIYERLEQRPWNSSPIARGWNCRPTRRLMALLKSILKAALRGHGKATKYYEQMLRQHRRETPWSVT